MDTKVLKKIKNYKEKQLILDEESRLIYQKITRLNNKIKRRKNKKEKINSKLRNICQHKWVPNFAYYNVYDRPKICEICGIDK